jgi:hypothetical protein
LRCFGISVRISSLSRRRQIGLSTDWNSWNAGAADKQVNFQKLSRDIP